MKAQTIGFLLWIALISGVLPASGAAHAATLTVNSLADIIAVDGECTLREAIQNANKNAATHVDCAAGSGADTITFSISGTITLSSALPTISDPAGLTLDGTGQTVTISGDDKFRVLYAGDSLTLNTITIAHGYATGGVVGGGVYACCSGSLVITNSTFISNSVDWEGRGGAIFNYADALIVTNSIFSGNSAVDSGGAIYNSYSPLTITHSVFSGNSAGGAAWGSGGGAIHNGGDGAVTIIDCTFSGNTASTSGGGGIYQSGDGALSVISSTFSANSAGAGAAIYHLYNDSGASVVTGSTFSGNSAKSGGGIFNGAGAILAVANSTFVDNDAIDGRGGGVYNNTATLTVANSTFSGNGASGGGGSLGNYLGTVTTSNTIAAHSVAGGNCANVITDGGNNIEDGITCGWDPASGSMSNTDPLLGDLTGSPAYFPLNDGSPAIDAGNDAICAAAPVGNQSQNGLTRPQGAHCDIGSYESVDTLPPVVQAIARADKNPTGADNVRFAVTFSEAVTGVDTSDFALTVTGVTGASITAVSGGATVYTVTVNTGSGSGTLRLDAVDDDTIEDLALHPLGGTGAGNGNYTGGETYDVRFYPIYLPLILRD